MVFLFVLCQANLTNLVQTQNEIISFCHKSLQKGSEPRINQAFKIRPTLKREGVFVCVCVRAETDTQSKNVLRVQLNGKVCWFTIYKMSSIFSNSNVINNK